MPFNVTAVCDSIETTRAGSLNVFGVHDALYFGREQDGTLENEFSGNLVEVCPTGVFTDKTLFHHYTRKWDLNQPNRSAPIAVLAAIPLRGERYGILRRITNRFNNQVNGYFLCDRGRFGYEYVNSDNRIKRALLLRPELDRTKPAKPEGVPQVLEVAADRLRTEPTGIVGIGRLAPR